MHIVHVAAENDNLPGAKVGGIGDVVRDIAPALADLGQRVTVLTPSHGFLHLVKGAEPIESVWFPFRGLSLAAQVYDVPAQSPHPGVRHCVIHHAWLDAFDQATGRHRIYVNDAPDMPFFSDGSRFACFCSAAAVALCQGVFDQPDVVHLHDWHAAFIALLRRYHPACTALKPIRTVFSIHNLALQGVRPLRGSESSLEAWFPEIHYNWLDVADPRWPDSANMMACGIRLSDRVHTVSPSYAQEICRPSDKPHFYGAEGLEAVLRYENDSGKLVGILNGCPYPPDRRPPKMALSEMLREFQDQIVQWSAAEPVLPSTHFIAHHHLSRLAERLPADPVVLLSVTRLTDQKVLLMREPASDGRSALEHILVELGFKGCFFLLGTGDGPYERFLTRISAQHPNFIFLNGYSDRCAEMLYANGDLFLMPSSFEPCGISQLLAMRDGNPCVVHAVGGLRDTVRDGRNGFCFGGEHVTEQVDNFIDTVRTALRARAKAPKRWQQIRKRAAATRFNWKDSAQQYVEKLYVSPDTDRGADSGPGSDSESGAGTAGRLQRP
jgi:starch synthase